VRKFDVVLVEFSMGAGGKNPGDVSVAFHARSVPHVMSAFDLRGRHDGAFHAAARGENRDSEGERTREEQGLFSR
jgi:hypothetical protein